MMELPSDSPIQQNLTNIYKSGERARDLVKQILTFARKGETEKAPIKISSIVKERIKLLRSTIPSTIEINYDLKAKQDIVLGDRTQMDQIVMNLCTNAVHAMPERGMLEIRTSIEFIGPDELELYTDLNPGQYLRLSVSDTGSGISPDVMDNIFEPYFTTKDPDKGTGMGLAVVHGIVKGYSGDITVESEVGKGTTVHVLLPLIESEVSITEEVKDRVPTGNEHILFVDDEKI
jgi:signal transduction histidine kinase